MEVQFIASYTTIANVTILLSPCGHFITSYLTHVISVMIRSRYFSAQLAISYS